MNGWGSVSAFLVGPRADVLGWFKTEKRASVVSGGRCLIRCYGTVLCLFLLNRASNISISLHGWE